MTTALKARITELHASYNRDAIRELVSLRQTIKGRDLKVGDVILCPGNHKPCTVTEIDGYIIRTDSARQWDQFYLDRNDTINVFRA
ncbi:hypothetical protein [Klebsiella phage vB_KpnS_IME279]|uniref:Uncharacterized protein n=1 Tax=Klebsiella phage vB_KpnS_IME279 TaxID=2041211 RepID=A0A291LBE9_9CAUD|nr:hypothetical protein HOS15_gp56 [Klebsiella phage vB_KpnS_IME279]ATI16450.1 hypothetical protein [Klebsiella phage vB_KpnS_IME279]